MHPERIYDECTSSNEIIIIDEIQKIPNLLDEVHRTIEDKKAKFLLTGSSARKIKRTQSNLLGGRAAFCELLPLTQFEITDFDLEKYLNHGGIPRHYLTASQDISSELDDYTALYLKQEVLEEALTRRLDDFARFLEVMALHSGDEVAIEHFASDCGIKSGTFRNYLEILKDTLIGFEVSPFLASKKRKAITRSKIYLFDVGVTNSLARRGVVKPKSELWGKCFEHFMAMELRAYLSYKRIKETLCYWRTTSQFEVDFIIGNQLAVEVKATNNIHDRMLKGIMALKEEGLIKRYCVVSDEPEVRIVNGIEIMPWSKFLELLWAGKLI
jgi:predicted AAA+ superfamily ATPase